MIELVIGGPIVSKKNLLKFNAKTRHPYYDTDTKANLAGIRTQLEKQWTAGRLQLPPLAHPSLAIVFYVSANGLGVRSDRDNKLTTVLDCMVDAGILKDDSIDDFNGEVLICKAVKTDGVAGARIYAEPNGNFGRLFRYLRNQNLADYEVVRKAGDGYRFKKV